MGKGTIQSHVSDAYYTVQLNFHGASRVQAIINELNSQIDNLNDQISGLPDGQQKNILLLQVKALEKMIAFYQDYMPSDPTIEAWCVDLTEDLSGEVATIEIPGERQVVVIRPGYTDSAAYNASRDGQLQPVIASSPSATFLNLAIFPGWQKWKPTYRVGIIVNDSMDYVNNTCSVCIQAAFSSQQSLNVNLSADWASCSVTPHSGYTQFANDNPAHPIVTNETQGNPLFVSDAMLAELNQVNNSVNSSHAYQTDKSGYGVGEHWAIMGAGDSGDCEDFALTKMDDLINQGWPVQNLQIALAYTELGTGHAVVMIRSSNRGNLILDNRHLNVKYQANLPYSWDKAQLAGSSWGLFTVQMDNVSIEYMDCHAGAFADGDRVVVEFTGQDWDSPKVIGFETNPQQCGAKFYVFGGNVADFYWIYDDISDSWSRDYIAGSKYWEGVAVTNIGIYGYLLGAEDAFPRQTHSDVLIYNTSADSFASGNSLPSPSRKYHKAFAVQNACYVSGGNLGTYTGSVPQSDFDKYNPISNSWQSLTNLDVARWAHGKFNINNLGYIYGGRLENIGDNPNFSSAMIEYDPIEEIWSNKSNMLHRACYCAGMTINQKGYVFDGLVESKIENEDVKVTQEFGHTWPWITVTGREYDPIEDSWSSVQKLPEFANYHQATGGSQGIGYHVTAKTTIVDGFIRWKFYQYNPTTDSFTSLKAKIGPGQNFSDGFAL